jgi:DNA polymerase
MRNLRIECARCGLAKTRHRICIGKGSLPADVLFLGEGPGNSEDVTGIPFYGVSGKLLDTFITETKIKFTYYISNIVLCHPTDKLGGKNREPEEDEVFACMPNIMKIYEAVRPKITILVGKEAEVYYKKLLKPCKTILHPSFILRTGNKASPYYFHTIRSLKEAVCSVV